MQQDGRESKKKCYIWVYCSGEHDEPIVYYEFHESRASESAKKFLKDYTGYLHSDGYEVYHRLGPGITVVGCLAHIKRKFTDAIKALSPEEQKKTVCFKGQEYCDYLFHIEKKYKDAEPEERHRKHLTLLKPVMDAFLAWLKETKSLTVPKSRVRQSKVVLGTWKNLKAFPHAGFTTYPQVKNPKISRHTKLWINLNKYRYIPDIH